MNIKNFFTKKNILISSCILVGVVLLIFTLVFFINSKPSKILIADVDNAWTASKEENQPEYLNKLDELSSYKLNSVKRENDRYIINTTVTAPDLCEQLDKLDSAEFPQGKDVKAINTFLCQQIEKSKIKKTNTKIYAYKIDEKYHITFSDDFADAMSGNLYEFSRKAYLDVIKNINKEN